MKSMSKRSKLYDAAAQSNFLTVESESSLLLIVVVKITDSHVLFNKFASDLCILRKPDTTNNYVDQLGVIR